MHATFQIGGSVLMASDGCGDSLVFKGFVLSLSFDDEADVERAFNALAEGATIGMPLAKTFWSLRFGMVTDRFGMGWMVTKPGPSKTAPATWVLPQPGPPAGSPIALCTAGGLKLRPLGIAASSSKNVRFP